MKRVLLYLLYCLRNVLARSAIVDPDGAAVVTLTSHADRIGRAFAAIESISRGRCLPRRILLYLGRQHEGEPLPHGLLRLRQRGLEIVYVDDVGPHTKYYPWLLANDRFDHPLATADDDKLYPRNWLAGLLDAYRARPDLIHCWRAREIRTGADGLRPYREWPLCATTHAAFRHLATGVGGVIYPPAFLHALQSAGDRFQDCCPKADDLWLHVTALREGFRVRQVEGQACEFTGIPYSSGSALQRTNMDGGQNDTQAARTYTDSDLARLMQEAVDA